jgi:hypothetical protein
MQRDRKVACRNEPRAVQTFSNIEFLLIYEHEHSPRKVVQSNSRLDESLSLRESQAGMAKSVCLREP